LILSWRSRSPSARLHRTPRSDATQRFLTHDPSHCRCGGQRAVARWRYVCRKNRRRNNVSVVRESSQIKNRSFGSERSRGSESALSPVKRMCLRRTNSPTAPILKPVATGAQPRYTNVSSASPNTIAPTKKLMTVNPITRRRLIPAIAKTGKAQNGWIMLATCSPMATAMAVAACDVCS
jgi:hypothetical protein